MSFRKNYLPRQSQPWAREIQSRIQTFERDFTQSNINNRTRDDQLQASYNRLDKAFVDLAIQQDSLEALINNIYVPETQELNGVKLADGSVTADKIEANSITADQIEAGTITADEINSQYVYAGSIEANQISAGTLTGFTIQTSSSGQRVVISNDDRITFYRDGSSLAVGFVYADSTNGMYLLGQSQLTVKGQTTTTVEGVNGLVLSSNSGIDILGGGPGNTVDIDTSVDLSGNFRLNNLIGGGTTGASINDQGSLIRTTSSIRYKTDVKPLELSASDVLSMQPKSFKLKDEYEVYGNKARDYPGFIAEDLAGTGLDIFVSYAKDENGNLIPDGIRYAELTSALLIALQELNQRVTELENG